jgi:hypothetical protein
MSMPVGSTANFQQFDGIRIHLIWYRMDTFVNIGTIDINVNREETWDDSLGQNIAELESYEDVLKEYGCPVCLEVNLYPVRFPCHHILCLPCAQAHHYHASTYGLSSWTCPLCRVQVEASTVRGDPMLLNIIVATMTGLLAKIENTERDENSKIMDWHQRHQALLGDIPRSLFSFERTDCSDSDNDCEHEDSHDHVNEDNQKPRSTRRHRRFNMRRLTAMATKGFLVLSGVVLGATISRLASKRR